MTISAAPAASFSLHSAASLHWHKWLRFSAAHAACHFTIPPKCPLPQVSNSTHLFGSKFLNNPFAAQGGSSVAGFQKKIFLVACAHEISDILVIGAPMYNFGISSTLKAWLDHTSRAGITFKYTPDGPIGLLPSKKVYLAVTSGGIFSEGPYAPYDFLTPYLLFQLAFIGLKDVKVVRAEGFSIPETRDTALDKAVDRIEL